jgi:hypothetical protein
MEIVLDKLCRAASVGGAVAPPYLFLFVSIREIRVKSLFPSGF